jgi:hypothetical protein
MVGPSSAEVSRTRVVGVEPAGTTVDTETRLVAGVVAGASTVDTDARGTEADSEVAAMAGAVSSVVPLHAANTTPDTRLRIRTAPRTARLHAGRATYVSLIVSLFAGGLQVLVHDSCNNAALAFRP